MDRVLSVMLWTCAIFFVMMVQLAAKPKYASRINSIFVSVAVVAGLLFYGYGYAHVYDNLFLAVIHAVLDVFGMAVGKMNYDAVSSAPGMDQLWVQIVFWLIHLLGFYATASAAITTIGAEALRKLRLLSARMNDLNLIYGLHDESLELGKELLTQKGSSLVFVDRGPSASHSAAVAQLGCVLRSDSSAVNADDEFLKSIGFRGGNRKIHVYVLSKDTLDGYRFAKKLLDSMRSCSVKASQTSLVLHGYESEISSDLQAVGNQYGYGSVTVFQDAGLAARLLIQKFPPCDSINFDEEGRATEDFETVIVGFGRMGQMILRNLVMNGQFEGSHFRASVFAPDCNNCSGFFASSYGSVLQNYDITFYPYDGRDRHLMDFLLQRGAKTKYVVICTGSEKINSEIAEDLYILFEQRGLKIPIYLSSYQGVRMYGLDAHKCKLHRLYQSSVLSNHNLDRLAMVINHHYQGENGTDPETDWMKCDYFSRMSSRAFADFIPAMLRIAGKTEEQALAGQWSFSERYLENLGKTEHLRWCAFHYCMGFSVMSDEEFDQRGREYLHQKETTGEATIRIGKNLISRTHACLVDWDALDELAKKKQKYTGQPVNYKLKDIKNVLVIPQVLQAQQKIEE